MLHVVEIWAPDAVIPQVERERVVWLSAGATDAFDLAVPELFWPL